MYLRTEKLLFDQEEFSVNLEACLGPEPLPIAKLWRYSTVFFLKKSELFMISIIRWYGELEKRSC